MFEGCSTLLQLNERRRSLVQGGSQVAEVNAAYNRAKRALIDSKPDYRKPPTFSGTASPQQQYKPYPMFHAEVPTNTLRITDAGIYF